MIANHTKLARAFAEQLGLPRAVVDSVGAAYEQWDGRGWPSSLAADAIPLPARIVGLAEFMEVAHRVGGVARALEVASSRSGSQFDPQLVATLRKHPERVFGGLDSVVAWDAVIEAEPALRVVLSEPQFDSALLVLGGCTLNRDIERLVRQAGFAFDHIDKYYVEGNPKFVGWVTRAVARVVSA